jgi:hypothetical protein
MLKPEEVKEKKYRIMIRGRGEDSFKSLYSGLSLKDAEQTVASLEKTYQNGASFKIRPEKTKGRGKESRLKRHEDDRKAKAILVAAEMDAEEASTHSRITLPGWVVLRKSSWFLAAMKRMGKAGHDPGPGVLFVYEPQFREYVYRANVVYAMRFCRTLQQHHVDAAWGKDSRGPS